MSLNDEQFDERMRQAFHSRSDDQVDLADLVQKRVHNRRRRQRATFVLSAAAVLITVGMAWWLNNSFDDSRPIQHAQPVSKPSPIAKSDPTRKTIAEAFPPPVEQLAVIGNQQDALVAVLEKWNEE